MLAECVVFTTTYIKTTSIQMADGIIF